MNFIAAHDGFALADIPAYAHKHNHANGEQNRDGHNENHSWNNGVEGATDDPAIRDLTGLVSGDDLDGFLAGLSEADFARDPDPAPIWKVRP